MSGGSETGEGGGAARPAPARRVTTRDVAERAGVNAASVSVVLNGARSSAHVSADTRRRILEAADALGYRRNRAAAQTRSGRFGSVALLLSTDEVRSRLPSPLLNALLDALAARGWHLSVFRLPDEALADRARMPGILTEWMADGILVDYTHNIPPGLVETIEANRMPVVWSNTPRPHDAARPDDEGAGREAARRVLAAGHRRVAYVDLLSWGDPARDARNHYSSAARYRGARDVLAAAGVADLPAVWRADEGADRAALARAGLERVRALLRRDPPERPTAVICYDEGDAVLEAAAREGVAVPDRLSVVGFGRAGHHFFGRESALMLLPDAALARELVALLAEKIADPSRLLPARVVPFDFRPGDTLAAPPPPPPPRP